MKEWLKRKSMFILRACVFYFKNTKEANRLKQEALLLQLLFIDRNLNEVQIAEIMKQDVNEIKRKLIENNITHPTGHVLKDSWLGIYTGGFHATKAKLMDSLKIIKESSKIIDQTEQIVAQATSVNTKIIKEIVDKMAMVDRDTEDSAGAAFGLTRAETLYKGLQFGLVLHDVDAYYSERFDHLLSEIIKRKDDFYFDNHSNQENWHPYRKEQGFSEYIFGKTYGKEALDQVKEKNNGIIPIKVS